MSCNLLPMYTHTTHHNHTPLTTYHTPCTTHHAPHTTHHTPHTTYHTPRTTHHAPHTTHHTPHTTYHTPHTTHHAPHTTHHTPHTGSVLEQHYQPAKDRLRPHMLEMLLRVPPRTTTSITLQFNRAFLKWTEHPPDAHHGFYIKCVILYLIR